MNTNETLELLRQALAKTNGTDALRKGFTQSVSATTGLTAYDLEAPAKTLYPVITPLRNVLPRVGAGTGIQANWRAITGINTAGTMGGVSEGNRGGVISTTVQEYLAAYKGLGLEDFVTFEADYAAKGFDDVRARATQGLLRSLMIVEEKILLGGNGSVLLGTTPTPTLATATTGGAIGATTAVYVGCAALTLAGYMNNTVAVLAATVARTNADGSADTVNNGVAQKSATANVTTGAGTTNVVTATVTAVKGAVAYAWFVGDVTTQWLQQITTINSAVITTVPSSGVTLASLPSSDHSADSLVFDGYMYIAAKTGSNSYIQAMATGTAGVGTPLSADSTGGILEFDQAFQSFWDNYRLSPDTIWVSSQEMNYIRKKILAGGASFAQRFVFDVNQGSLIGGTSVRGYTNPFTMGEAMEVPIRLHPNMPPGTIMFTTQTLPYPLSGVTDVARVRTRQEYYQLEWPLRTRKYEYGVYVDEVLQHYFPPSIGIIHNIAQG